MSVRLSDLPPRLQAQASQQLHANHPHPVLSHAKPKPKSRAALVKAPHGEAPSVQRTIVRFTGYRVRPLDPDNFAGSVKDLLDGLRYAGLLSGDEPWRIRLETDQVKVGSSKDEKTLIEIITPEAETLDFA